MFKLIQLKIKKKKRNKYKFHQFTFWVEEEHFRFLKSLS